MKTVLPSCSLSILFIFVPAIIFANAPKKPIDIKGTWTFEAVPAPPEYSSGKLIFFEKDGKLEGVVKYGEFEIALVNLKTDGDQTTCGAYLEGEYISISLKFQENDFTGTAAYSEGKVELSGKREASKVQ